MRVTIGIALVLICCILPKFAMAGGAAEVDYSFDNWQTEDGLPYNSVTSITQTRDGYLWIGTYNGLVRFDGIRFVVFDPANTPQMRDGRITSLFEDSKGCLWIGHETGELNWFSNGEFKRYEPSANWPEGEIVDINSDGDRDIWLLNKSGTLFRLRGVIVIPSAAGAAEAGEKPISLAKANSGTLWACYDTKLASLYKQQLVSWKPGGNPQTNNIKHACASRDGGLWVAGNGQIRKWNSHRWADPGIAAPWGPNTPLAMVEMKSGDLAVGTLEQGLFLLSPDGTYRHFDRQNGLSHDWVRCLCEDREGTLWVGTGGGGLEALRIRTVGMVKVPDDWQGRAVLSVTPAAAGGLWVGSEGAGIYRLKLTGDEKKPRVTGLVEPDPGRYVMTNGLYNSFMWSLLEDVQNRLWVGSWGSGLFLREGENFLQPTGLESNAVVTALYQGSGGALWIGTATGLVRYQNGARTWFKGRNGEAIHDVRTIVEDSAGNIWFGTLGSGLCRLRNGVVEQFHKEDGLANDSVWSLFAEDEGTVWIGTFGGGLSRYKNGHFTTVSTKNGLPSNVICHMADDGRGNFWLSSYAGIFRVPKNDLRHCADAGGTIYCFTYGKRDGLSTLECSGGFQPSGCQTSDGRLWFPTSKGLAVVDPANVRINPLPPPTIIEEIKVEDEVIKFPETNAVAADAPLEIQPGKQRFGIRYTGLSLISPEKVHFRYRLEGLETEWTQAGGERVATFSYLKPATYTFHVEACNSDGVWDELGASVSFRVLPHFWQTWWFSAIAIVAGGSSIGGAARYLTRRRLRAKMEKLERQRALEKERTRIAKDIHDDLGASLTRITLLSQSGRSVQEDPHQAAADLDQIYNTARELTRAMDEIVWAVSPQHDTLDSLVTYLGKFAQDFLSVAGIRCRLNVPIELPAWPLSAEVRHNLFLAFKEALNNVLKHASATEVRVSLTLADSGFWLCVDDNGRGFDPAMIGKVEPNAASEHGLRLSSGNGLANIKKRLEDMGGTFELKTAPGEGVMLKFDVKVKTDAPA